MPWSKEHRDEGERDFLHAGDTGARRKWRKHGLDGRRFNRAQYELAAELIAEDYEAKMSEKAQEQNCTINL